MGLGDYSLYPNYYNFTTNKYSSSAPVNLFRPCFLPEPTLSKPSTWIQNNYTNADDREYGLCLDNSYSAGTTTHNNINLGLSNVFFVDGVCINHANEGGQIQFNPGFADHYKYCRQRHKFYHQLAWWPSSGDPAVDA